MSADGAKKANIAEISEKRDRLTKKTADGAKKRQIDPRKDRCTKYTAD